MLFPTLLALVFHFPLGALDLKTYAVRSWDRSGSLILGVSKPLLPWRRVFLVTNVSPMVSSEALDTELPYGEGAWAVV